MPDLTPSMPAEPLGPSKDLTLNSGGFFMLKSRKPGAWRVTGTRANRPPKKVARKLLDQQHFGSFRGIFALSRSDGTC